MPDPKTPLRGRGTGHNARNRFETVEYIPDPDSAEPEAARPRTEFVKDTSRSIITYNESPDVGFEASLNPYRGCEHGCIYCYARPYHEYLGFSAGLDFETKIVVKQNAPDLLRKELSSPRWVPKVLALSGVTDPYQPIERRLVLTRRCLEVLAEFGNPAVIITKNHLVTRDMDVLGEMAAEGIVGVFLSITTLDHRLAGIMEPRTAQPGRRLDAVTALSEAGIPTGVFIAPVIPGLTDHELPSIVEASARAGAAFAGFAAIRLPYGVGPLFERWLAEHAPEKKDKVLGRIRALRGGRLNDPRFGSRMRGSGVLADQISKLFKMSCRRSGIIVGGPDLSTSAFRRPPRAQRSLFE